LKGCDYTIGCAQTVIEVTALNMEEAKDRIYDEIRTQFIGESELEYCEIYEVNDFFICNLKKWYNEISLSESSDKLKEIERREKEEYERLKLKFNKQ
jgi:hypothetical protein